MRQSTAPHSAKASFAVSATVLQTPVRFLVDTGADVSILPSMFKNKALPLTIQLRAANGSEIRSYGYVMTSVIFQNLRRSFAAKFIVADVTTPILGADFFRDHGLLINVSKGCIIDSETNLCVNLAMCNSINPEISVVNTMCDSLVKVLTKNSHVFDINASRPQPTAKFQIKTTSVPKPARAYRLSPEKTKAAKQEIESEVKLGRMVRSSSQYASPLFAVPKPDGSWRFVADYTRLNNVTIKDNYIPPRIDDLLARVPPNSVFTKLDLQKAFFQIPIEKEDQPKTAVITPFGLYEYTVMSMGLKNASQTMQRYVDTVLSGFENAIAYCDDILLFTDKESHAAELDKLLQAIHNAGLLLNKKNQYFKWKKLFSLVTRCRHRAFNLPMTKCVVSKTLPFQLLSDRCADFLA